MLILPIKTDTVGITVHSSFISETAALFDLLEKEEKPQEHWSSNLLLTATRYIVVEDFFESIWDFSLIVQQ